MRCGEYLALLLGLISPMIVLPQVGLLSVGVLQEALTIFSVLLFLIGGFGVITFRVMARLFVWHGLPPTPAYLSSGPFLGQLERLAYTVALLAHFGLFIVAWLGIKTLPYWVARKFEGSSHKWAISLAGNLMNVLAAAIAAGLIGLGAPCVSEFIKAFGV